MKEGYEKTLATMLIEIIVILSNYKFEFFRYEKGMENILYFFEQNIAYQIENLTQIQLIRLLRCFNVQALHNRRLLRQAINRLYASSNNF